MARQRFIHPEFWTDSTIGKLSPLDRLFFIGCISNADDEGRLLGDPAYLRSVIFPYDDIKISNVEDMRDRVVATCHNLIHYIIDGTVYLAFRHWSRYQAPRYPKPSRLPPPPDDSTLKRDEPVTAQNGVAGTTPPEQSSIATKSLQACGEKDEGMSLNGVTGFGFGFGFGSGLGIKRSSSAKNFADDSLENFLAQKLKSYILTNNPKARPPDDLSKWCVEFEKILRIDKRSLEDIEAVMAYSQSDPFWMTNVLSPKKLREHFDKLYLQAKKPRNKASPAARTEPQAWGNIREWLNESEREVDNRDPPGI